MRRRVYEANRGSSIDVARQMRETFTDRPASRETVVPWQWPETMLEIGKWEAVMYASDKWQKNRGDMEDYKHIAESKGVILARHGFLRDYGSPGTRISVVGPNIELGEMPDAFAVLADILGVQMRLYEQGGRKGYRFPEDEEEGYYQVLVSGGKLGGGRFPDTGEVFLIVYNRSGVHLLLMGEKLDVLKDGIVG